MGQMDRGQAIAFMDHLLHATSLLKLTELSNQTFPSSEYEENDYLDELSYILEDFQDYDVNKLLQQYFAWEHHNLNISFLTNNR